MKHIIVIDDSPTIRMSLESALKELGFPMDFAENGSDAIEVVKVINGKGEETALCIVDINMPVMDGIKFISEFRKLDKYAPVLVLTTESEEQKIKAGKSAGATGWIIKPFRNQDIVALAQKLIK